jgi:hypothetical protein
MAVGFSYMDGIDSDVLVWLTQIPTPLPTQEFIKDLSDMVKALKGAGIWSKLDRFWVLAAEQASHGLVSVRNPNNIYSSVWPTSASTVNSPSFQANRGYTSNGTSSYINLNYNTSTQGVNYTLNSACFGIWNRTSFGAGSSGIAIGGSDGGAGTNYIQPASSGFGIVAKMNGSTLFSQGSQTTQVGLLVLDRTSSSADHIWINGSLVKTNSDTSQAVYNANQYVCCYNGNGSPASFFTGQLSLAFYGSGTINQNTFYNILQTFATKRGF